MEARQAILAGALLNAEMMEQRDKALEQVQELAIQLSSAQDDVDRLRADLAEARGEAEEAEQLRAEQ